MAVLLFFIQGQHGHNRQPLCFIAAAFLRCLTALVVLTPVSTQFAMTSPGLLMPLLPNENPLYTMQLKG